MPLDLAKISKMYSTVYFVEEEYKKKKKVCYERVFLFCFTLWKGTN